MEWLAPEDGFLGLPSEEAVPADKALAAILPFGLEHTVSYTGGTSKGPQAMIAASHEVELFDEELWCEPIRHFGVVTAQEPAIANTQEAALDQLDAMVEETLEADKFPFVFGGEHAITPGAIRPFTRRYEDFAILHFDAHADLRDGYDGEHYSHAAALRRCLDYPQVSALVSLGIRNISASEVPFLEANKKRVHIHWAKDKADWKLKDILAPLKGKPIYVTFDLDGFDASLMPATGTPEPGGLFWDDVMPVLKGAAKIGTFIGADINELAPREGLHSCDFLAAKLAYKILGYHFTQKA